MMSAPDHVDAWCTRCGRRSQRSPLPHSKLTTAHDPRPRTDRRCRSADAALRTTSLSAAGLDVTSVCDLVALVDGSLPKLSHELERSIMQRMSAQRHTLSGFYVRDGKHEIFYSRKVGYFLQVLDFEPRVLDGRGRRRPPSEFKQLTFASKSHAKLALCCLNSSLFYWFVTVFSDCRHVNRREVDAFPIDLATAAASTDEATGLADKLMRDLKRNSVDRSMRFQHDTLTVQCIYPKFSKALIDQIDELLSRHYGFSGEELDFIVNYDIKYRAGADDGADDE